VETVKNSIFPFHKRNFKNQFINLFSNFPFFFVWILKTEDGFGILKYSLLQTVFKKRNMHSFFHIPSFAES